MAWPRLAVLFAEERDRWVLWLPVPPALGILAYFALPFEPPAVLTGLALITAIALLLVLNRQHRLVAIGILLLVSGFAIAQWRTLAVAAPVLRGEIGAVNVTGQVDRIEPQADGGVRLVLAGPQIAGLATGATPRKLRLSVRTDAAGIAPGDRVRLLASLRSPPGPVAPGAFDFARKAYFEGVGGVGFSLSALDRVGPPAGFAFWRLVHRLRLAVDARIRARVEGRAGAMASALLTGLRGGIPEPDEAAMQTAGLAHLLAISGLHMGLLTASAFFLVRLFLAAIPSFALRRDTRKAAAIVAWLVAFGYLLLAGATYPTQRAFVMTSVVLFALLLDRQVLSLRLVAFAALVILALAPESLLSASFQMSFAAVVALVAVYERLGPGWREWRREANVPRRLALYFLGVLLTTAIAELAIAPFAAYHFNRLTTYGLLANLVAVPVMAFWVMPLGLAALALMPFGLEAVALTPMGWGTELVLRTAGEVAALPGSAVHVPAFPGLALFFGSLGGLWVLLWRTPFLRLPALLPLAVATALLARTQTPDLLVGRDGGLVALVSDDGLFVSSLVRGRFERAAWARHYARDTVRRWDRRDARGVAPVRCDAAGCRLTLEHDGIPVEVAVAAAPDALLDDCRRADLLIAPFVIETWCPHPRWRIDRTAILKGGAHAIYVRRGQVRIDTVAESRGIRPWSRP
ncbi:MAG: ComEC/Rec2 family competence protein [Rhodothalassiaceae bacterium]